MIKLGWMARASTEEECEGYVKFASELRLDVIDFHIGAMPRDTSFLRAIKMMCLRAGLPIGYLGIGETFVGPDEEMAGRMERAKADVDMAAFLSAQLVRVFGRHHWPDTPEEQEALWGPMIERFQELSDYAAEKGVAVGLQNHDDSSFVMTADQALRVLRDVDRENFTFIMDTGQWEGAVGSAGGGGPGTTDPDVDLYKDYLEPTAPHAAAVRAKIYKIDNGYEEWIDYNRVLEILKTVNFNGNISIVFEGGDRNRFGTEDCLRLAARHLREVLAAY